MTTDPTDAELVARTLAGDTQGFELLVRRYRRVALARACALLTDFADAEDVVQATFIRVHDQLPLLRAPDRVGPWIMTMVRNLALNSERGRRRQRTVAIDAVAQPEALDRADERVLRADLRVALLNALAQIPPVQREVVLLADLEGCAHAEISRLLDISVAMSRRHLSDARLRLRSILSR